MGRSLSNGGADGEGSPVDLAPLANVIGYRLRRAQLYVFQDFLSSFSQLDIRPAEYSVLMLIEKNPGMKQSEIAAALGIKRANFVRLMDALEERGLAERRPSATDRRSHALYLTEAGENFIVRMQEVWREHEDRLVQRIGGTTARDQLIELLDRIIGP